MKLVKNTENRESIYEIVYEESTIKELISEIITNCSIRVRGRHRVEANTLKEAKEIIDSLVDSIGNKIYENVTDIREEQVNDPFDYWRHGDPVPYSFEADVLVSPKLVGFLNNLLSGEDEISLYGYEYFEERKELSEKTKLAMEINTKDYEINQISNYDTERKMQMLEDFAYMLERLKSIPNFDYEKLSKYYDLAGQAISLELVQETFVYKKQTPSKSR